MKKIFFLLLFFAANARAQQMPEHILTLTAEGITRVTPDIIRCSILFSGLVKDINPKLAEQKIINKALLDLRINTTAIFVPGESSDENYDDGTGDGYDYSTGNNVQHVPTSSYNKSYYVTLSSFDEYLKLSQASSAYMSNGVKVTCSISFIGFKEETKRTARDAAFKDAMAQAKAKSVLVTQTLGGTIGALKSVQEYYNDEADYTGNYYDYAEAGKPLMLPYSCSITVMFELK